MVERTALDIPASWLQLPTDRLRGIVLIIGASDTGKSCLARYLYERMRREGRRVAFLDGDPGQSTLGPPTTITLAIAQPTDDDFPPVGQTWRWFIGSVSPRGHMLPLVVGGARLAAVAQEANTEVVIYDTTGLVEETQGGLSLKLAKIELLRPAIVIAIQRRDELEPLLTPLRRSRRTQVIELQPSVRVEPRDPIKRQAHRSAQFARYFAAARPWSFDFTGLAVFPHANLSFHQLVALEDVRGFTLGLGILLRADLKNRQAILLSPLSSLEGIDALRLGDLTVDPKTWQDRRIIE